MPFALRLALFGLVATGLTVGLHYYLWKRLVDAPGFSPPVRRALTALVVLLGGSLMATLFLMRLLGPNTLRPLAWVAFIWMGLYFFLFLGVASSDLVIGLARRLSRRLRADRSDPLANPARRVFLARARAGAVAVAAGALGVSALRQGLGPVQIKPVRVELARLPARLEGTTLVQLTDVHVGPTIGKDFIREIVRQTNALSPDIIAITGDLVDGSVRELREAVARLGELRARHGVFFVTGNHEYYSGVEPWLEELGRLGIRVLRNERVSIGPADASFDLAGVDDHQAAQYGHGHGTDLGRALAGRQQDRELVLLAHQPRIIGEASAAGVGLVLSGHTHGGQIWPWSHMVRLQQPHVRGLVQEGPTQLYISCGTGYWGPPMRLGAPAEITRVELHRPRRV